MLMKRSSPEKTKAMSVFTLMPNFSAASLGVMSGSGGSGRSFTSAIVSHETIAVRFHNADKPWPTKVSELNCIRKGLTPFGKRKVSLLTHMGIDLPTVRQRIYASKACPHWATACGDA
jgi:hypothetical protein